VVVPPSSQFHAQDELGQFSFGYQNINSARTESKDAFGVTRGSYQYVDANNVVQTVHYTADDVNGFRVAATNVPVAPAAAPVGLPVAPEVPVSAPLVAPVAVVETPEVAAARAEHLAAHEKVKAEAATALATTERKRREAEPIEALYGVPEAPVLRVIPQPITVPAPFLPPQPVVVPQTFAAPIPAPVVPQTFAAPIPAPVVPQTFAAPITTPVVPQTFAAPVPAPVVPQTFAAPVPAPVVVPPSSQFHAQDELGQFSFGYQNINSARTESKDAFGVTRGSYQYVDANNVVQTVHYTADDVNGFRVAATNVPVAPAAAPVGLPVAPEVPVSAPLVAPVAVVETPEVAAARAEHLAAHEKAKAEVAAASEE